MSMIEMIKNKARADIKRIVLPEGDEPRTITAAATIKSDSLAAPILIGNKDTISAKAAELGVDISGIEVIDPLTSDKKAEYANLLFELRKAKGVTEDDAAKMVADPMYFGIMMVKTGDADGLVSGAVHTTGDMLRPALQIIKTKPGMKCVSSSFLMDCPNKELGENGLLVYADCVVMPCPTAEELASIAVAAAETARTLCCIDEPRVAMLSFSTKGSAKHELVSKVQEATKLVLTAILSSQIISNVPAAMLLSAFTDDGKSLVIGTNLGGLGTLIASMASLITYKYHARLDAKEKGGNYILAFSVVNIVLLIVLYSVYLLIS